MILHSAVSFLSSNIIFIVYQRTNGVYFFVQSNNASITRAVPRHIRTGNCKFRLTNFNIRKICNCFRHISSNNTSNSETNALERHVISHAPFIFLKLFMKYLSEKGSTIINIIIDIPDPLELLIQGIISSGYKFYMEADYE